LCCIWDITIEAHSDSRNGMDYGVHSFVMFCIWLVMYVSCIILY
jgi:hypothetical protein